MLHIRISYHTQKEVINGIFFNSPNNPTKSINALNKQIKILLNNSHSRHLKFTFVSDVMYIINTTREINIVGVVMNQSK